MGATRPQEAELFIAGVGLRVSSERPLLDTYDGPYEGFAASPVGLAAPLSTIDITLTTERPSANTSSTLFESGGPWNVQLDSAGYRLNLLRAGSSVFHTVACCDSETTSVRVHMDQDVDGATTVDTPGRGFVNPVRYPLDQLLMMNHLASRGGVIVHAAGLVLDGKAVVLPGRSGAGKSTIARLLMDAGLGSSLLSDDRVILRIEEERKATAWGTPWPGDARVAKNDLAPLAALLFLVKAETTGLLSLSEAQAAERLMPVITCPWYDAERLPAVLDTCSLIVQRTPCYELHFRPDAEAAAVVSGRSW